MRNFKLIKWPRGLIYLTLYMTFCVGLLESFGLPHIITYTFDILTIIMIAYLIGKKGVLKNVTVKLQLILFAFGTFIAIIHFVSPALITWALRNNIKYIVYFAFCLLYMKEKDIKKIQSLFYRVEYINFVLVFVEFYILGFNRDNLGGIFGTGDGVNGILNCFMVLQLIHHFVCWMKKEENVVHLFISTGMSLVIAAFSEIKIYFVELAFILLIYLIWTAIIEHSYKVRTIIKFIVIAVVAIIGANYAIQRLVKIYPEMSDFFSLEKIIYHATKSEGYTGHGDLNRLSAIETLNRSIFSGNLFNQLFGLGLGATEFAEGRAFLTSAFYNRYQYLHYSYFSLPWMYLETGFLGLALYLGSYIAVIIDCIKTRHQKSSIVTITFMVGISIFLFLVYNQSMRLSSAYLVYTYIVFMYVKDRKIDLKILTK